MCGRCRHVFNAFQSLARTAVSSAEPMVADEAPPPSVPPVESFADARDARTPLSTVALETTGSEHILPRTEDTAPAALITVNIAKPGIILPDPPEVSTTGNNLLLKERKARSSTGVRTGWWVSGVVLLTLTLAAQSAYYFRTTLLTHFPQWRPLLSHWCESAGCTLSWGRDAAKFEIVTSDLVEASGKTGRIQLTAILVNRSDRRQDLPSLQLKLTDHANQVVASRILNPSDYLGRKIDKDDGLASNVELYVNLNLDIANKPLASGYGLAIFFP